GTAADRAGGPHRAPGAAVGVVAGGTRRPARLGRDRPPPRRRLGRGEGRAGVAATGPLPRPAAGDLARPLRHQAGRGVGRSRQLPPLLRLRRPRAHARAHRLRPVPPRTGAAGPGQPAVRGGHAPTRGQGRDSACQHVGGRHPDPLGEHPRRRRGALGRPPPAQSYPRLQGARGHRRRRRLGPRRRGHHRQRARRRRTVGGAAAGAGRRLRRQRLRGRPGLGGDPGARRHTLRRAHAHLGWAGSLGAAGSQQCRRARRALPDREGVRHLQAVIRPAADAMAGLGQGGAADPPRRHGLQPPAHGHPAAWCGGL
ncbi:MAG: Mobile element protein, partial [uncultured Craurococcus sp.]